MSTALDPRSEERLKALDRYQILDTFPESRFERLTRLASNIFGTPISLISLIDEHRQWFKSHRGMDECETPLGVSFCKYALEQDSIMVVPDATQDDRFRENPLVTSDPGIRFYAGAPLRTPEGTSIGTLCVIDTLPRPRLTAMERQILEDLAALVIDELELRAAPRKASGKKER